MSEHMFNVGEPHFVACNQYHFAVHDSKERAVNALLNKTGKDLGVQSFTCWQVPTVPASPSSSEQVYVIRDYKPQVAGARFVGRGEAVGRADEILDGSLTEFNYELDKLGRAAASKIRKVIDAAVRKISKGQSK